MGTWGKEAELDVEMTTPLTIVERGQAKLPMPVFSERNFAVSNNHEIDLRSVTSISANSAFVSATDNREQNTKYHIVGNLSNSDICTSKGALGFSRNGGITAVQAVHPLTKETIQETFTVERLQPPHLWWWW